MAKYGSVANGIYEAKVEAEKLRQARRGRRSRGGSSSSSSSSSFSNAQFDAAAQRQIELNQQEQEAKIRGLQLSNVEKEQELSREQQWHDEYGSFYDEASQEKTQHELDASRRTNAEGNAQHAITMEQKRIEYETLTSPEAKQLRQNAVAREQLISRMALIESQQQMYKMQEEEVRNDLISVLADVQWDRNLRTQEKSFFGGVEGDEKEIYTDENGQTKWRWKLDYDFNNNGVSDEGKYDNVSFFAPTTFDRWDAYVRFYNPKIEGELDQVISLGGGMGIVGRYTKEDGTSQYVPIMNDKDFIDLMTPALVGEDGSEVVGWRKMAELFPEQAGLLGLMEKERLQTPMQAQAFEYSQLRQQYKDAPVFEWYSVIEDRMVGAYNSLARNKRNRAFRNIFPTFESLIEAMEDPQNEYHEDAIKLRNGYPEEWAILQLGMRELESLKVKPQQATATLPEFDFVALAKEIGAAADAETKQSLINQYNYEASRRGRSQWGAGSDADALRGAIDRQS